MRFLPICLAVATTALAHAQYAGTVPVPEEYRKGIEAIRIEDAKSFLGYLAGPECEGRGTVQPGFQKAARFMADHFRRFGLKPVGDHGTYFQIVHFARTTLDPSSTIMSRDGSKRYAAPGEIAFGSLNRSVDVSSNTVWLKVSDTSASLPSISLEGKLVFVVSESFPAKLRAAVAAKDPMAVIWVTDTVFQIGGNAQRPTSVDLSRVSIVQGVAKKIAADQGLPASLFDGKDVDGGIQAVTGTSQMRIVAQFTETDPVDAMNVVGLLPGSDPTLRKEIVGIGAHLDHLGKRGDTVYPGADDDGSGSTALLEIMKAYHDGGQRPRRSILFMAFCGEEMGLLGSGYYSDNPIFPHDQMIAELQMDMVGRDSEGVQNGDTSRVDKKEENIDTIRLVGSKRISTDLDNLIEKDNRYIGFKFKWDAEDVYTRSDHYNFAKHGIPIAFLFDGFHPDYHRPTDTVDKIDWVKLTNAAKLYYIVSLDLADHAQRPRHDVPQDGGELVMKALTSWFGAR
ncbi:MAG TPA: M28 family peptidase [Fimbriimonadaceae bacterium]|nr:M28 family peptidase [Fimbriimonadaceae bacterium]